MLPLNLLSNLLSTVDLRGTLLDNSQYPVLVSLFLSPVRIFGVQVSSSGPNVEAIDMAWEVLLSRSVSKLAIHHQESKTDFEIII